MKMSSFQSLVPPFAARGILLILLAGALPCMAQSGVSYQPSQRLRTALETCMKDEVLEGAYCVKKCQPHFRLDVQKGKPPVCIATSAAAKIPASATPPVWEPPPKAKAVPGA